MTTYAILPNGKQQFIDSNGNPLASGKVYYYIPNTTTFKNTYQDDAGNTLNSNPIILDANGQCMAYGTGSYRQAVYDVNNNLIWDVQVDAPGNGNASFGNFSIAPSTLGTTLNFSYNSSVVATITSTGIVGGTYGVGLTNWTTATRPGAPTVGLIGYNSTTGLPETWNGTYWASSGASANGVIYQNNLAITSNFTLNANNGGMSVGPINIASGVTVTIPSGSRWVVL